ncbi:MAG: hypothetical protein GXO87_14030 [Chlorobi bacterium]|nr:hypothetical protein [Chlorobiota bacterium]
MNYIKSGLLLIVMIVFLVSCSKDSGTEPTDEGNNTTTNASGQPTPTFSNGVTPDGMMATIQYAFDAGVPGIPPVELAMGYAQFGAMVNAGDVIVNENQLSASASSGQTFYIKPGIGSIESLSNVFFNGSTHSWTVSGSGDIPALSGDIQSVNSFNVTSPANNSTVSKSQNLKVTWSGANNSDEKMMIVLVSVDNSNVVSSEQDLTNNGSYTIDASKLSSVSGQALLQVLKYRYKTLEANGKSFYLLTEVVRSLTLTVQ